MYMNENHDNVHHHNNMQHVSPQDHFVYDPQAQEDQEGNHDEGIVGNVHDRIFDDNDESLNNHARNQKVQQHAAAPEPMMNNYDFEYHTEKDEGSTANDPNQEYDNEEEMYNEESDVIMPLVDSIMENNNPMQNNNGGHDYPTMMDENQTVDSEMALHGNTPVKKKNTFKPKKRRKPKVIIDNIVDKAYTNNDNNEGNGNSISIRSDNAADGNHYREQENDGDETHLEDNSLLPNNDGSTANGRRERHGSIASSAMREISAHARQFVSVSATDTCDTEELMNGAAAAIGDADASQTAFENTTVGSNSVNGNGNESASASDTRSFSPRRNIGPSKSYDSQQEYAVGYSHSSHDKVSWDGSNNSKQRWAPGSKQQQHQQHQQKFTRASKSWDEESSNNNGGQDSIAAWGTWGDHTASLFGDGTAASGTGGGGTGTVDTGGAGIGNGGGGSSDKENLFDRKHNQFQGNASSTANDAASNAALSATTASTANARALAEWDKAEAEWRENVSVVDDVSVATSIADDDLQPPGGSQSNDSDDQRMQMQQPPPPMQNQHEPPPRMVPQQQPKKNHPWSNNASTSNENMDFQGFGDFEKDCSIFDSGDAGGTPSLQVDGKFAASPQESNLFDSIESQEEEDVDDDDDDSIFEFEKQGRDNAIAVASASAAAAVHNLQQSRQQQPPTDPAEIFLKIKSSLKQADKTKNRALGIQGIESNDSNMSERSEGDNSVGVSLNKQVQIVSTPAVSNNMEGVVSASNIAALKKTAAFEEKKKKRISFVSDAENTIHTYTAPDGSSVEDDESEFKYEDEEEEDSHDCDTNTNEASRVTQENKSTSSISLSEKISPDGAIAENGSFNHEESDTDTYGDSTIGDSITYKSGQSDIDDTRKDQEDNMNFMDHVDNAVTMMTSSLGGLGGLFGVAQAATATGQTDGNKNADSRTGSNNDRSSNGGGGDRVGGEARSMVTEDEKSVETDDNDTYGNDTYGESTVQSTLHTGRTDGVEEEDGDWLGYMRNMIFPKETDADGGASVWPEAIDTKDDNDTYDAESTYNQEDEDNYLLQQALAAARAIHHVQGVEFDETQEINVLTDIKFVVVTVSLPLGLLFQEHEIGVWVSRVVPNGNGYKKGVQHGDQLAAINGNSSVHTTIDEVASSISSTPDSVGVELTFLRYIGPLRPVPGSIIQEGFEVMDTSVSDKKKAAQAKSKRSLFSKKKSSSNIKASTPPSSPGISTRRFGIDISPKRSPKRSFRTPPKFPNSSSQPHSSSPNRNKDLSAGATTSNIASSSKAASSRQDSALSLLPLSIARPSTKKKKSLGKLLPFKKKT